MGTLILVGVYVLVVTILIPFVLSMCCLATWTLVKALIIPFVKNVLPCNLDLG